MVLSWLYQDLSQNKNCKVLKFFTERVAVILPPLNNNNNLFEVIKRGDGAGHTEKTGSTNAHGRSQGAIFGFLCPGPKTGLYIAFMPKR